MLRRRKESEPGAPFTGQLSADRRLGDILSEHMASSVGIRFSVMRFFGIWPGIEAEVSSEAREREIRHVDAYGAAIVVGLWTLIARMVALSVVKLP